MKHLFIRNKMHEEKNNKVFKVVPMQVQIISMHELQLITPNPQIDH